MHQQVRLQGQLWALRAEVASLRAHQARGPGISPASGVVDGRQTALVFPATPPPASKVAGADPEVVAGVAASLLAGRELFTVNRTQGVCTASLDPLAVALYRLTPQQQRACTDAMSAALTEAGALTQEKPGPWQQTEDTPQRQVFSRQTASNRAAELAEVKEGLFSQWRAVLSADQLKALEKAAGQLPSGAPDRVEQVVFEVTPEGEFREESMMLSEGQEYCKDSRIHGKVLPKRLLEMQQASAMAPSPVR